MQINGRKLSGPKKEVVVFPRTDELGNIEDVVFIAEAILDFEPFEKLCPMPKPPQWTKRDGSKIDDTNDKSYKIALQQRNDRRLDWMVITSIRNSPGLVWDSVNYSDPDTWSLYKQELKEAGFSQFDVNKIVNAMLLANNLDEAKMEEARNRFLRSRSQDQQHTQQSLVGERPSTQTGVPASDSASNHQG